MSSRKLRKRVIDIVATDIDDASIVVEELQNEPDVDTDEKLDELHDTLEHAADTIDKTEPKDE